MTVAIFFWIAFAILAGPGMAQTPEEIWQDFVAWGRNVPAGTGGKKSMMELYTEHLVQRGVAKEEAERRAKLISGELREKSRENNIFFWDTLFRIRRGPDRPLKLLMDIVHGLPPGRALDVAMGNGRNSAFLAFMGWQVTGYDISPEAIELARQRRDSLAAKFEILNCGHQDFEFGEGRWDLILFSYIVADDKDLELVFGPRLWRSLRPGGRIVCEGNFCERLVRRLLPLNLERFRLERYSDADEPREDWGGGSNQGRVIRAVIRKQN